MKKFALLCIAAFLFFFAKSQNENNNIISIDSALSFFKINYPQEKVSLQLDRDAYTFGETVWMKTWCLLDGAPTFLSRVIYVDLVDKDGLVVLKKMYKLDSLSSTPCDLDLPVTIKTGNYTINAYTLWMLNFPEFIATKNIFIYGADYKANNARTAGADIKMSFFPEGGELIEGIENRVAFKIINQNGYPVNLNGNITDRDGKLITTFTTKHDGMGSFVITPLKNNEYRSTISNSNGATLQFKLPAAKNEGVAMQVDNTNANRAIVSLKQADANKSLYNKIKVVAQMNGELVYAQYLNFEEGLTTAAISKKNLPPGILQITLFTEKDVPIAERIIFISNYKIIKPEINTGTVDNKKRALNRIIVGLPGTKASFMVKISDASLNPDSISTAANILSDILLTADIKGHIYQPGYYFKDKNNTTLSNLDLLLLTNGWRRFQWKKILNNRFDQIKFPPESAMALSGLVTKSDRSEIIKKGIVSFIIKTSDSATILAEAKITDKGEFVLSDLNFIRKASIAYMGTNEDKKNYIVDIKMYPSYIDSLKHSAVKPFVNMDTIDITNAKNALAEFLANKIKTDTAGVISLANVTVKGRRRSPEDSLNREYAEGPFLMGKGINPADFKNYKTIWQIIQAAVPGVTVQGNPFDPTVTFNRYDALNALSDNTAAASEDFPGMVVESSGIAYFLNGQNVTKDIINSLFVDDIAFIKVLKQEATVLGATQGAIAIYTKTGAGIRNNPYDKVYSKIEKDGYALVKEFYPTDYQLSPELNKNITDNRYLILWNGKPIMGRDGKYHFRYFNNDLSHKLRITVQGIDKDGQFIYQEQILQ
jgi:hypothetical protein